MKLLLTKRTRKPPLRARRRLLRICEMVLDEAMPNHNEGNTEKAELHIILIKDREMQTLNQRYLGHDYPTDVLAFDLRQDGMPRSASGEWPTAGEIYVGLETACEFASCHNSSVDYEVVLYIAHGMLHLAGEDDMDEASQKRMRAEEDKIMEKMGGYLAEKELFGHEESPRRAKE